MFKGLHYMIRGDSTSLQVQKKVMTKGMCLSAGFREVANGISQPEAATS